MGKENNLIDGIYYKGGTPDCIEGAWNEFQEAGGGRILMIEGMHACFIPPDAKAEEFAANSGSNYDEHGELLADRFLCTDLTVGVALEIGEDITEAVIKEFGG